METENVAIGSGRWGGVAGGGRGCDEMGEGASGIVCELGEEGLCFGFGECAHDGE